MSIESENRPITMIPIYVINLDRSKDRMRSMESQLNSQNLDFHRFPAFDGGTINIEKCSAFDLGDSRQIAGRELSKNEIGCAMSHLSIYKEITAKQIEHTLILEDDIFLPPNMNLLIQEVLTDEKWDVLLIHHRNPRFKKFTSRRTKNFRILDFKGNAASTAAYFVRLRAAEKLLKKGQPLRMVADRLTGDTSINRLRICGLIAPPIQTISFKSTIQQR
ncbi:MAG: glycosyltransferase family 25 protein [Coraliomargarita sp.]